MSSYTRDYDSGRRDARDTLIRGQYLAGWTTDAIASEHGLSRRRVQVILDSGTFPEDEALPTRSPYTRTTRVYFIQEADGGPVKIGTTTSSPHERLAVLQIGNPRLLGLRRVIERDCEREMHDRFAHLRITGEWFRVDDDLEAFMSSDDGATV